MVVVNFEVSLTVENEGRAEALRVALENNLEDACGLGGYEILFFDVEEEE